MRYFLDTEFHEDGRIIDLISIGIVAADGREYYAVSNEFQAWLCNEFVRENVLPKLPPRSDPCWKSRKQIAEEVKAFLLAGGKPEIWGYFSDYDWVALCQLYGRMVDLPKGFPFWCRDLKQLMAQFGITKKDLPDALQTPEQDQHSAIADARWNANLYVYLRQVNLDVRDWLWDGP